MFDLRQLDPHLSSLSHLEGAAELLDPSLAQINNLISEIMRGMLK